MFIGMILETLGVGLVIPLLTVMTKSDLHVEYPSLQKWFEYIGNPSPEELVIMGMIIFVAVYTVKVIFLSFFAWWQARFVSGLQVAYSQELFTGYLRQPYTFHLQHNSAHLIHNVIAEVGMFTNATRASLVIMAEILAALGISILLLSVEPLGASIVIITLCLAAWIIHKLTKGLILNWGQARQLHDKMRLQHLQQGFGSAKDIKILGRENEFINQFRIHNTGSAKIFRLTTTMEAIPRLLLELLCVISLIILVIVMIKQNNDFDAIVPVLGLFTVAAFRIMPSVNRVLSAIQNVRFARPAIEKLYDEFMLIDNYLEKRNTRLIKLAKSLELNQVNYCYPNMEDSVLHDINLIISKGTSVGFIGGTGTGKSTLVDIILGLLTPKRGKVLVDGVDIQHNLRGWQDQIGYVPQSIYITDDTVRRNVAFGLSNEQIDEASVWKAIRSAHLESFIKEMPEGLDTILGEHGVRLSGGQRQRIGIARALYHDPNILVLDEATSSLDISTERGVMDAVRELHGNKTILIVAHRLATVEDCDWVFRLDKGMIVEEGVPDDVLYENASNN